jgi:hypothetical protein
MPSFHVYFRNDLAAADLDIDAGTAEEALRIAREIAEQEPRRLNFELYCVHKNSVNEIEVCDEEDYLLEAWRSEEMHLRLWASALLKKAEKVLARWQEGDMGEAIGELNEVVAHAKNEQPKPFLWRR